VGVHSHQTALSIYELSDVNPVKLYMAIPVTFRRRAKTPKALALHRARLEEKDVEQRQGFAVTRPIKAIDDLSTTESVSCDFVQQALTEGRRKGIITGKEVAELQRGTILLHWFNALLAVNLK